MTDSSEYQRAGSGLSRHAPDAPEMDRAARERSFSRRALIKAGWSVPVIVATVNLPTPAFAGSTPHGDAGHGDHGDNAGHSDSPHIDSGHADAPGLLHSDAPTVSGHGDAPAVIGQTPAPAAAPTAVPAGGTTVLPSELPPSSNGLAGTGIDARKLTEIGLGLLAAGAAGAGIGRERLAAEGFDDDEDFLD